MVISPRRCVANWRAAAHASAVLRIGDLSRSFREGERVHRVLDHANAAIAAGEVVAIIGRSGSGKSTLLNLISGIDRPDGGTIEFDGRVISALAEPERTLFRRTHVGFVYQLFNLLPTLDVEENVRLVLELNGIHGAAARAQRRRRALGGRAAACRHRARPGARAHPAARR